jgi:hypothetical protein
VIDALALIAAAKLIVNIAICSFFMFFSYLDHRGNRLLARRPSHNSFFHASGMVSSN